MTIKARILMVFMICIMGGLAATGQSLLLLKPPSILIGSLLLVVAMALFVVLSMEMYRAHSQQHTMIFVRILRFFETAPLGALLLFIGIIYSAATFWFNSKPDMLPWVTLSVWGSGLFALLIGTWDIDRNYGLFTLPNTSSGTSSPNIGTVKGISKWEVILLIAITIIAFFLRQKLLGKIPYNLSGDEAEMGLTARRVLSGEIREPFATSWLSHPNVWFFVQALSLKLFGNNVAGLRMVSALIGTATVPALYLFARLRYGTMHAIVASALLATYHLHIHYSRNALNNITDTLPALIAFTALLWGIEKRSLFAFMLTGVLLGVAQHFYMGARLLPVLLLVIFMHQLVLHRARLFTLYQHIAMLLIGFFAGFGPLLTFFIAHPETFNARYELVGLFHSKWFAHQQDIGKTTMTIMLEQIQNGFGAYIFAPDRSAQYDPGIALLEPVSAALFMLGIALLVTQWRRSESVLLLAWVVGTAVFGGVLLASAPASPRYVSVAPVLCLTIAVALVQLVALLQWAMALPRVVSHAVQGIAVAIIAMWNITFYFIEYTPRNNFGWINVEIGTELGYYLAQKPDNTFVYFFGPPRMYYGFGSIQFLAPTIAGADVHDPLPIPEALPKLPHGKQPLFVFLPERRGELDIVRKQYAVGETHVFLQQSENTLFLTYEPELDLLTTSRAQQ